MSIGVVPVTSAEAEQVTELFSLAFFDDPTWSWAFPWPSDDCTSTGSGGAC
jgi:hypothetical protein